MLFFSGEGAVGGNPGQLQTAADALESGGQVLTRMVTEISRTALVTEEYWRGDAAAAYRSHSGRQVAVVDQLVEPLRRGVTAYRVLAADLATAQERAAASLDRVGRIGLNARDLLSNPVSVALFLITRPDHYTTVASAIAGVLAARQDADTARDAFVATMSALWGTLPAAIAQDRRDPDERGGRRIRSDELFGRSEGGDRGGGHFDNDWAGRAILERYLRGGGDWTIADDEDWTGYMTANELLSGQLLDPAQVRAQSALDGYLRGAGPTGRFDETFQAEIQNGEGIVGYQYLHGTNEEVGGFRYNGTTVVTPKPNGTYEVAIDAGYTWNDVIDPNPQYSTDRWKSRLAEIVTLGQADPYDIHITWHGETTVVLDAHGNVLEIRGYPAP